MAKLQAQLPYGLLLAQTAELKLQDSLAVSAISPSSDALDSLTLRTHFFPVLASGTSKELKLKNRLFYLAGKFTGQSHYDLLLLVEDKRKEDSTVLRTVYVVSTKKDGTYIASLKAAMAGTKKKTNYQVQAWLYPGMIIRQYSQLVANKASMDDHAVYHVSNTGRFILE